MNNLIYFSEYEVSYLNMLTQNMHFLYFKPAWTYSATELIEFCHNYKEYRIYIVLRKIKCALAESVKRSKFCIAILRHTCIFFMKSFEKICRVEEKENIFENSEFTCFCKILRIGKFLPVKLIIIIKWENIQFWYFTT